MPKITVQVSDKSLDFFSRLMKELKIKILDSGEAPAAEADMVVEAQGDVFNAAADKKKHKDKDKDKKKKKKDKD